jgi:hypothetical protein
MKTLEEALDIVLVGSSPDRSMDFENMRDLMESIQRSEKACYYLAVMPRTVAKNAPKRMKLKKRDIMASIALTAFANGIRVGQEMEKQDFKGAR